MKQLITILLFFTTAAVAAQNTLVPGKGVYEKKWLKAGSYGMEWFVLKDTLQIKLGEILTHVKVNKRYVSIVTEVKMKNSKASWVDTTIAKSSTLEPVSHSSYNAQRDMLLNFGNVVTGFYYDKRKQQNYSINDTAIAPYFDSNIYPALIAWLPLHDGYKNDISIYDYNPSEKKRVVKSFIKKVTSAVYQTKSSGLRNVWIVTVSDEISNDGNTYTAYYIDKNDRKLWKQEINAAQRKMIMLRKEP